MGSRASPGVKQKIAQVQGQSSRGRRGGQRSVHTDPMQPDPSPEVVPRSPSRDTVPFAAGVNQLSLPSLTPSAGGREAAEMPGATHSVSVTVISCSSTICV